MTLSERYKSANLETLVTILEKPQDYTMECFDVALNELKSRNATEEECKKISVQIKLKEIKELFEEFNPHKEKIVPPKSFYLSDEGIMSIIEEEFANWLEKREAMGFDVMQYSIPGSIL